MKKKVLAHITAFFCCFSTSRTTALHALRAPTHSALLASLARGIVHTAETHVGRRDLRDIYATAFEVSPTWLVEAASRRQKWIDQAQSLNIYMAGASGKKLDETYKLAWLRGLKTTYYLRTIAATHMEKSTTKTGALNAVAVDGGMSASAKAATAPAAPAMAASAASATSVAQAEADGEACYLRPGDDGFEECEACQ